MLFFGVCLVVSGTTVGLICSVICVVISLDSKNARAEEGNVAGD